MAELKYSYTASSGQIISLWQGDITEEDVDAIVNAANERLQHGGGVAGVIVRRGGRVIQEESDRIGRVATGKAVMTGAGKLKARWVIHAVGPVYDASNPDMDELLKSAVRNSMLLAHQKGLSSLSLPAISSGIFGFPKERCARDMIDAILEFIGQYPQSTLCEIRIVIIDSLTVKVFLNEMESRWRTIS
jgi:putative ATPase